MPRDRLLPYEQGHLDGLCGVYSIVNAVQFALWTVKFPRPHLLQQPRRLSDVDAESLFETLLGHLVYSKRLARNVVDGIGPNQINVLLRLADKWLRSEKAVQLASERPLHRRDRVGPKTILGRIVTHLSEPGTAAIVGADPPWRHWTVATRVTKSRLHLLDSGGYASVPLRLGRIRGRYHAGLIQPSHIYLVRIEQADLRDGSKGIR